MNVPLLDLELQYSAIAEQLDSAVAEVVRSQRFVMGPVVDEFERRIESALDTGHAISCASGTDAILLALKALQLPAGSEVIVPAFTFFATAGAVWNAGLRPVFVDIDPRTFNMTPEALAGAVTQRTRAAVPVHLFGQMAPMAELGGAVQARGIPLIEDAAQAIYARQRIDGAWRQAGTVGLAGCLSFFPTKNLGGFGDGGMVTTDDAELAERLRKLRVHGGRQMYHHEFVGTNSRLDALQAAVLTAKLPHLEDWTRQRQRNAARYLNGLDGVEGVVLPVTAPGNEHVYNQFTIRAERRDELRAHLDSHGIGSGIYYPVPLHLQECFRELGYGAGDLPESESAAQEVLSLPVFPELATQQLDLVIETIRAFYGAS